MVVQASQMGDELAKGLADSPVARVQDACVCSLGFLKEVQQLLVFCFGLQEQLFKPLILVIGAGGH
jgi:hypothetical protein